MPIFRSEKREAFTKQVAYLIAQCRRVNLTPGRLIVDHNLMIDVFGSQASLSFVNLPTEALPLTYGHDHIMVAECADGVRIGLYMDGRTEQVGQSEA